jgi:hypothetical protein
MGLTNVGMFLRRSMPFGKEDPIVVYATIIRSVRIPVLAWNLRDMLWLGDSVASIKARPCNGHLHALRTVAATHPLPTRPEGQV